jgi:hypothetical protein
MRFLQSLRCLSSGEGLAASPPDQLNTTDYDAPNILWSAKYDSCFDARA